MADIETNATTVGIAAALIALKEIGMGIWKALRKGNADRKQAREEAKVENAERDQWTAINALKDAQAAHELHDASIHTTLITKVEAIEKKQDEMASDIKTLLRRSTDQIKRSNR